MRAPELEPEGLSKKLVTDLVKTFFGSVVELLLVVVAVCTAELATGWDGLTG